MEEAIIKNLSSKLSQGLAIHLINVLKKQDFNDSLFAVELSYKNIYCLWPVLNVITEKEKSKCIQNLDGSLNFNCCMIDNFLNEIPIDLQTMFREFDQHVSNEENWKLGEQMLINTARIMTSSKLHNTISVSEDFIAYAFDWELDEDRLEEILIECGANAENVNEWKKF